MAEIFFVLSNTVDMKTMNNLVFSLSMTANITNISIKLESPRGTGKEIQLFPTYTGVAVSNGFYRYTVPLTDFSNSASFNLSTTAVPFEIWNPKFINSDSGDGTVIFDDVYIE